MSNAMRYWAMIAVLLAGIAGMGLLSHGESTPPATPLSDFPDGHRKLPNGKRVSV